MGIVDMQNEGESVVSLLEIRRSGTLTRESSTGFISSIGLFKLSTSSRKSSNSMLSVPKKLETKWDIFAAKYWSCTISWAHHNHRHRIWEHPVVSYLGPIQIFAQCQLEYKMDFILSKFPTSDRNRFDHGWLLQFHFSMPLVEIQSWTLPFAALWSDNRPSLSEMNKSTV